ncbi:hypothetical protein GCM10010102_32410 [Promicromonospora citrea]|uniref:Tetratricopeptide repeat protein n=1 Tax=Promicromonospora citrea TaxID=43677 RepID=A0A8H9GNQ5_9MICO|nr:hypothetical protein GCM10010102_32410 [Promicromonospora citrea]
MAEAGPGRGGDPGGRRLWIYGFASTLAIVVGVGATVLPDTLPSWLSQPLVVGAAASTFLGATLLERYFTLRDRHNEAAGREADDRRASRDLGIRPPDDNDAPGRLLSPVREGEDQIVRFFGREDVLQRLIDWCLDSNGPGKRSLRVQLVTGPGGVGKTRLAHELQTVMRRTHGWECRNLRTGVEAEAMQVLRRGHGRAPVLFVVDYAENRTEGVTRLLDQALADPGAVRVLLLARREGRWWSDLCQQPDVGAVVGRYDPIELATRVVPHGAGPGPLAEQQRIVDLAAQDFARHLGRSAVQVTLPDVVPSARMLDLLSIALVEVLRSEPSGPGERADTSMHVVFDELVRHEARSWTRSAQEAGLPDDSQTLRILVAAACLLGAEDQVEAEALVRRVAPLCPPGSELDPRGAARWLREQYPPTSGLTDSDDRTVLVGDPGWIGSLHPDRLAEHLVVSVLMAADVGDATRALTSQERRAVLLTDLTRQQAERAMIVLTRAASDPSRTRDRDTGRRPVRNDDARLDPREAEDVARLALDLVHGLDTRWALVSTVHEQVPWPDPPNALHEVGHAVAELLVRTVENGTLSASPARIAHARHVLGNWAFTVGDYQASLEAREEATRIYRKLAKRRHDRHWPHLARALDNLGDSFATLGRNDEALAVRREAVTTWQQNVHVDSERFLPDLAKSLHNFGVSYRDLGLPRDALTTHREALRARRLLAAQHDRHRAALARSLSSIGRCHLDLGDIQQAHAEFVEALDHWLDLNARTPTRYEQDVALALGDLGMTHGLLGRPDDSLPLQTRAHTIWNGLAARYPVRFVSGLARSWTNLGIVYADLHRDTESDQAFDRAIAIYGELARENPERREQNLAWSLGSAGIALSRRGLDDRARDALTSALELFRRRYDAGSRAVFFVRAHRSVLEEYSRLLERSGQAGEAYELRRRSALLDGFLAAL